MTASPIIELCTLLLPEDAFGAMSDVSGASNAPNLGASAAGAGGAGGATGTGGAPGGGNRGDGGAPGGDNGGQEGPGDAESDGPGGDDDGPGGDDDTPGGDDPKPRKRGWRDRLFGGEKAVEDVAASAAEGLIIDGVLTGAGGGAMGSVPMLIGAGTTLAEGAVTIMTNEGRGLGGSSQGGKDAAVEARRSPDGSYHPSDIAAGRAPGGAKK